MEWNQALLTLVSVTMIGLASSVAVADTYDKASMAQLKALAMRNDVFAMSLLGQRYDQAENNREAVNWYQKAAERGHLKSQYNLALMYDQGEGVAENDRLAVFWYKVAAEQGHLAAQANLGVMYERGEGVTKDNQAAVKWFKKAAERGDAAAQYNLALMYAKGEGVVRDMNQAMFWTIHAAQGGDTDAKQALAQLRATGGTVSVQNYQNAQSVALPEQNKTAVAVPTPSASRSSKNKDKSDQIDKPALSSKGKAMWVFDPPSNVRTRPEGKSVLCQLKRKTKIEVSGTGEWLTTYACGEKGYIHRKQLRATK